MCKKTAFEPPFVVNLDFVLFQKTIFFGSFVISKQILLIVYSIIVMKENGLKIQE
jgi:hypothetical protein